jgi:membrane peptidoglycan carboxypeptidase
LAAFYAAIANEGVRPVPHAIDAIEENGSVVYRHQPSMIPTASVDPASFYQMKTMLQGVLQRGTAHAISDLAPYVAGKTGTSEDENDAWFVGLTNDVTVAVWVGYDNGDGRRRTLGTGQTGAHVALPIFRSILDAVWEHGSAKSPLDLPSAEASRLLVSEAESEGRDRSSGAGRDVGEARGRRIRHRFSERSDRAASVSQTQWDWRGQWGWRGAGELARPDQWRAPGAHQTGWREGPSGARREFFPGSPWSQSAAPSFGGRANGSFGFMFGR